MTNWEQVRIDYEKNGMTLKELAVKYKEKTNTIKGRRYREKWKKQDDSNSSNDIYDCMYEEGYSPKDILNLINPNDFRNNMSSEDVRVIAEEIATPYIDDMIDNIGVTNGSPKHKEILKNEIEKTSNELISDKAIEELIGEIVSEHIAIGLGKKKRVQLKYNPNGKLIHKTITNIQPTKEERESAIEMLLKLHSYRSNNDDTYSAYGYKMY